MQLALFDVDGTLIDSIGLCDERFAAAVAAVSGVPDVVMDWSLASDATDSGASAAHFSRYAGREPTPDECRAMQDHFVGDLRGAAVSAPAIPGAADVVDRVAALPGWTVGLATGNWRAAAAVKFGWAGMTLPAVPIGSADDAPVRADILRAAIRKAEKSAGVARFERVVYFGDGVYDVRAARAVGIGFVAVTAVREVGPLRQAGARVFLEDFRDEQKLREALDSAPVPGPSADR